eukprot:m.36291 g.36291  ORF g.36291 m.36291 type:complete len:98 (+) comp12461_c0_seq24:3-296(+)
MDTGLMDSFLMEQCPDAFQTDKAAAVGQLFSSSDPREHLVDNLLGQADLFHPDQLLMHFPQLAHLHIIPKKKTKGHEGEPDVEKFLIGLTLSPPVAR